MIIQNNTLKEQIIEQTHAFIKHAENRTADIVPSLPTLATQIYSWSKLSEEDKKVKNSAPQEEETEEKSLSQKDFKNFSRFIAEETGRRNCKRDAQPLNKSQILQLLMPEYEKVVLQYKADLKAAIDKKLSGNDEDPYAAYKELADKLRAQAEQTEIAAEEPKESQTLDKESIPADSGE